MNKKVAIISIFILASIGIGVAYLLASPSEDKANEEVVNETKSSQTEQAPISENSDKTGSYVTYTDGIIAETGGTKLLFFHAPWCPQCRAIEADINSQGVPEGVTIIKVDYDTNQELRKKYGVTLQTTIVKVDNSGELIEKFTAYDDPSLDAVVKNLL